MPVLAALNLADEALIQQACVVQMAPPDEWELNHIQHFIESPEMGPLSLWGRDSNLWGFTHDRNVMPQTSLPFFSTEKKTHSRIGFQIGSYERFWRCRGCNRLNRCNHLKFPVYWAVVTPRRPATRL